MKLKFLLRTIIDIKSFKNRNCWTCKHLKRGNVDVCTRPDQNKEDHEIQNCSRYVYIRDYKLL